MSVRVIVEIFPAADPVTEDWDGSWVEDFQKGICECAIVRASVQQPLSGDSRVLETSYTIANVPIWGDDDRDSYAKEAFTRLLPKLVEYGIVAEGERTAPDDIHSTLSV